MTDLLGKGWTFPPRWRNGGVASSHGDEKIRQSIYIILGTARGERAMRPDFGCGINDYVFETINASVLNSVREAVREALVLCEPRIDVLGVGVIPGDLSGDPLHGVLQIRLDYRIRATNAVFNMVYPFYLGRGS